jgi:hypothetical protein
MRLEGLTENNKNMDKEEEEEEEGFEEDVDEKKNK